MLQRVSEKVFRYSGDQPSKHDRLVEHVSDPESGLTVRFDHPVSVWRAMAALTEAKAMAERTRAPEPPVAIRASRL